MARPKIYTEEELKIRKIERNKLYALNNPDKEKAKFKRYREKHKEKILERERLDRLVNPEKYKDKQRKYLENNSEKAKENRKTWTENNRDKIREQNRLNSLKNRKQINLRRKTRRKTDPIYRDKCNQWSKDNLDKRAFSGAKRRAAKINATPNWLSKEDWITIKRFYKVSAFLTDKTGIKYVVDHIHPLQGKDICGLHVPWNLQILTDAENTAKGINIL